MGGTVLFFDRHDSIKRLNPTKADDKIFRNDFIQVILYLGFKEKKANSMDSVKAAHESLLIWICAVCEFNYFHFSE